MHGETAPTKLLLSRLSNKGSKEHFRYFYQILARLEN